MNSSWTPTPEWRGQDSFIIGGGSSLKHFDFGKLKGLNVIGCNEAFRLGPEIVKICLFADTAYWQRAKWDLEKFAVNSRVVSVCPTLTNTKVPWLSKMTRAQNGLHKGSTLGFNFSTGAAAINLAISLGSNRIYLLGFDLGKIDGKTHWHTRHPKQTKDAAFVRFQNGFAKVQADLSNFPDVEVLNVTDGSSLLPGFKRVAFDEFDVKLHLTNQNGVAPPSRLKE